MKAIFGIASLVVVLAIVGIVAKKQLQTVGAAPSSDAAGASAPLAPAQSQAAAGQVKQDIENALRQGAEARASEAGQ